MLYPSPPIKILFLAANPSGTTQLCIDKEQREIDQELRRAKFRDHFHFIPHGAVQVEDLSELLLRYEPTIVHFSGHGTVEGEIILQDKDGNAYPTPPEALSKLFKILRKNIRCVVLNACYSDLQAKGIAEQIDTVVGITDALTDDNAIRFSASFYLALAYGQSVQTAFDLGVNATVLRGSDQSTMLKLITNRVDAGTVFLHKQG